MSANRHTMQRSFAGDDSSLEGVLLEVLEFIRKSYEDSFTNEFATELVLREVITNSIRHGSPNGEEIRIEITGESEYCSYKIYDSGPIFSIEPKCLPSSLVENSRGLWILHRFAKDVRLTSPPKCLEFTITIKPSDQHHIDL